MIKWVLLVFILLANIFSYAGVKTGNGGGAWVCRENNGKIRWSLLVDLFEAESEFGLKVKEQSEDASYIFSYAQVRLGSAHKNFYDSLYYYFNLTNDLRPNNSSVTYTHDILEVISDSLYRLRPSPQRCENGQINYEQVVNYKNDGFILVQSELFNSLSETHKAALMFHEALYAYRRDVAGDDDSVFTRKIVGLVFSDLPESSLASDLRAILDSDTYQVLTQGVFAEKITKNFDGSLTYYAPTMKMGPVPLPLSSYDNGSHETMVGFCSLFKKTLVTYREIQRPDLTLAISLTETGKFKNLDGGIPNVLTNEYIYKKIDYVICR